MLSSCAEGEVAPDAVCLCDVTGSRTSGNIIMNFTCGCQGQLGSFRGGGEREQPGATGRGAMSPCPPHSPSFLGLFLFSWLRGPGPFRAPAIVTWLGGVGVGGSSLEPS